jgi:hypothetical protein
MTKRYLLFLGLLFSSTILCGQIFNEKYFTKTDWFSNNKDSIFHILDTLKFIKYSNHGPQWDPKEYAECEAKYLNHGDYVVLGFKRHQKMDFSWRYNNYMGIVPGGKWTWAFDKKTNQLKIYDYKKSVVGSFLPISERRIKIESRFADQKDSLTTTELTLIRMK